MQESYPTAVTQVYGSTIVLENPKSEYDTIVKLYTDGELVISMMNTLDKNIYEASIKPKDLVNLFESGKIEFTSRELFDIVVSGVYQKSNNITTNFNITSGQIIIEFSIHVVLNIKREFNICMQKKEQKDIDRICLIAQDIYDINQNIIDEENLMKQDINQIYDTLRNILKTNSLLYERSMNNEKEIRELKQKYNELEDKFNTFQEAQNAKCYEQEKGLNLLNKDLKSKIEKNYETYMRFLVAKNII